jgi:hypothetical protein
LSVGQVHLTNGKTEEDMQVTCRKRPWVRRRLEKKRKEERRTSKSGDLVSRDE